MSRKKTFSTIFLSVVFSALFSLLSVQCAYAQTDAAQKALEGVKESISSLLMVKDENNPNENAFRIETFRKVIDFSIVEAKDLKVKFLAEFNDQKPAPALAAWRDDVLARINSMLSYYEKEKKVIEEFSKEENIEEKIKLETAAFKKERDEKFIPLSEEIADFLLIEQQEISVQTAEKRWDKIQSDIIKLKKTFSAKKIKPLESSLIKAKELIADARTTHENAKELFEKTYLLRFQEEAIENATSSKNAIIEEELAPTATSSTSIIQNPSIKDMVKESLTKIRETYQIFIEMSNLVRKLL